MTTTIKVIEAQSKTLLFECESAHPEKAYSYAKEMEELGIEVEITIPSVSRTLGEALDLSSEVMDQYEDSIKSELEDHDGQELHPKSSCSQIL